jgi:uncharacterized protein (TIGR02271 family)
MRQGKSKHSDNIKVIPIIEEVPAMQKRSVETGGVRLRKTVREREEQIDEPVWQEEVNVERVVVNHAVDGPVPTVRTEGEVVIVPLLEEVLVVKKQLMLREELRITKRRTAGRSSQKVTLRREEARVERLEQGTGQAQQQDLPPHHKTKYPLRKEPTNG